VNDNKYDFYFCLGADSFIDLVNGKWQQTDRILNDLLFNRNIITSSNGRHNYRRRMVVLYRSQTKIVSESDASTAVISNEVIPSTRSSEYYDNLQNLVSDFGVQLIHMDRSENNISSTFVRNCSDTSKLLDNPAVILPEVVQYIQQHSLYQFCK
jgi:nicotinic acid mononucleotide adenylyltransferase